MAEPHPEALRNRVIEAYEAGEGSYVQLAARFAVGEATVKRWVQRFRQLGHARLMARGGGNKSTISPDELASELERLGDATAGEL